MKDVMGMINIIKALDNITNQPGFFMKLRGFYSLKTKFLGFVFFTSLNS